MCGTVAWLRKRRDDEQFDLAAWILSLKYRTGHVWPVFLYFPIFGQCELCWVFHFCGCDEVHPSHQLSANLHLVVRMHDKLRLPVSIDETLTIILEIHLETVLGTVN